MDHKMKILLLLLASASAAWAQCAGCTTGGGGGAPTGAAGGGLTGTYPNPTIASVPISTLPTSQPLTTIAGAAGTTANLTVAKDAGNPTGYVTTTSTSNNCFVHGFAASTVSSGGSVVIAVGLGLVTAVADNTITAGHIVGCGTITAGRVADLGTTSRVSLFDSIRVLGVAQVSATVGQSFSLLYSPDSSGLTASPVNTPTPGATCSMVGNSTFCICTTTCTVTPLAPVAGSQFCVRNDTGVSTVITIAAIASVFYEKPDNSAYGTVNSTMVSGGSLTDKACLVGRDSTHYHTWSSSGMTAN